MTTPTGTRYDLLFLHVRIVQLPHFFVLTILLSVLDSIYIGAAVDWVKVNTDMTGYYIVHYEDDGWEKMTKVLAENHTSLSYKDRTHLIHNAFQLVT